MIQNSAGVKLTVTSAIRISQRSLTKNVVWIESENTRDGMEKGYKKRFFPYQYES